MSWLQLDRLSRFQDAAFLALRLYLGGFLIWGVWDNIVSRAQMAEFQAFLAGLNCPFPAIAAPLSVYAQALIGVALILGAATRWAGFLLSINFLVATLLLARAGADTRGLFEVIILVLFGLVFASHGAGAWSLDRRLASR